VEAKMASKQAMSGGKGGGVEDGRGETNRLAV